MLQYNDTIHRLFHKFVYESSQNYQNVSLILLIKYQLYQQKPIKLKVSKLVSYCITIKCVFPNLFLSIREHINGFGDCHKVFVIHFSFMS